ncbi:uncharacterized protein TNCV_1421611 [Trichonephila clavipes]|nr:uncharacterized protein TNCV_1421611 [Trichonephila clavipes]
MSGYPCLSKGIPKVKQCSNLKLKLSGTKIHEGQELLCPSQIHDLSEERPSVVKTPNCPLTASPHKSLNSSRGVISEPDLICTPEAEILEGISGQGVIQLKPALLQDLINLLHTQHGTLSTEIQPLPESDPTASNGEHFNAPEVPQCAKRNSRNRRKCPKVQKAEIKIKMAPHRPRKSTPSELTTDEEDMIMYDVQAEELEPYPEDKFAVMECFVNNPSEYMRALTPTRFRNSSN